MKVLDALQAINEKYDADISFRSSCRAGQCGSCGILFKGNGALACQKEIKDGAIIEPLNFPVIKDLIVDKSSIEAKVKDLELSLQCDHKCSELNTSITKEDTQATTIASSTKAPSKSSIPPSALAQPFLAQCPYQPNVQPSPLSNPRTSTKLAAKLLK